MSNNKPRLARELQASLATNAAVALTLYRLNNRCIPFQSCLIHWVYWAAVPCWYDDSLLTYVTCSLSPNSSNANQLLLFQHAGVNRTLPFIRYTALKVVSLDFWIIFLPQSTYFFGSWC